MRLNWGCSWWAWLLLIVYCGVVTLVLLYIIKAVMGLRVTEDQEEAGVDTSAHGEVGLQHLTKVFMECIEAFVARDRKPRSC